MDFPERYGHSRMPIPYPTGILAVVTFLILSLVLLEIDKQMLGILIGVLFLAFVSFIDDRKRTSPLLRLGLQLLIVFLIFGLGTRIYSITNPLITNGIFKLDSIVLPIALFDNPPLLAGIFTVGWLMLTMNALNWFDGIPGQVSTLSFLGFATIGFLSISSRIVHANPALQQELGMISFILAGIALACLVFDFPPNKVLMGDSGAMFFGLMLGVLTIYAGGKVATAFLVLGVPLIDSFIVIIRRIYRGKNPMKGNAIDEHLHHRLLQKGWSHRSVIMLTAGLGSLFGISALFLSTREKFIAALLLLVIMIGLSLYSNPKQQS